LRGQRAKSTVRSYGRLQLIFNETAKAVRPIGGEKERKEFKKKNHMQKTRQKGGGYHLVPRKKSRMNGRQKAVGNTPWGGENRKNQANGRVN